jgi:BMFP domain-containing protein YqiC
MNNQFTNFEYSFPNIFTVVIVLLCLVLLFRSLRRISQRQKYAQLAVVIGIFGTFVGIAYGLLHFDVQQIDSSLPQLLGGLSTAFITSIAGQLTSIVITSNTMYFPLVSIIGNKSSTDDSAKPKRELGIEDIVDSIKNMEKSIVGDGESTMLTQIQKLRTSTSDSLSELNKSFVDFSKHMVENTNNAIVKALEEVIKDFNVKINEQFGDNFKRLNEAVFKLVEWQESYKTHVKRTEDRLTELLKVFDLTNKQIDTASGGIAEIEKRAGSLLETNKRLSDEIDRTCSTVGGIASIVDSLNEVSTSSKNMFPELEKNLDQLFKSSVSQLDVVRERFDENAKKFSSSNEILIREIDNSVSKLQKTLEDQVIKLDDELGKELTKCLAALGNQLASLSNQFVKDYTPLTEKLRQVVEIAKRLENE